jgi:hypothetical protein
VERPACNSYVYIDVVGPIPEDACVVLQDGIRLTRRGMRQLKLLWSAYGAIVQDVLEIDSPAAP